MIKIERFINFKFNQNNMKIDTRYDGLTFQEEKEMFRHRSPFWGTAGWEKAYESADPDISLVVRLLKNWSSVYTSGHSCSGSPKDHQVGIYGDPRAPTSRTLAFFGDENSQNARNAGRPYSGYVMLRADVNNPEFRRLIRELDSIDGVDIVEPFIWLDVPTPQHFHKLRVTAPQDIVAQGDEVKYQKYMEQKWAEVAGVLLKC